MSSGDAYRRAGVDYDVLDTAKREALRAAASTSAAALTRGAAVDDSTRGEPATLVEVAGSTLAVVLECLGTKSLVAATVEAEGGDGRWDAVGFDTVAAAVNDCCCPGALPLAVNAYFATGSAAFYAGSRHSQLVDGFRRACAESGAAWAGGESPTLAGVVEPDAIDLAASVLGRVPDGSRAWRAVDLVAGDEIVLVASSGLHANGASLARHLALELPAGFATRLASGRGFGEALLDPSRLYVALVESLQRERFPVHYASHVTGHGWRKLMRAGRELTYRLAVLPEVPEVLGFLVEGSGLEPREAYATFNMGAGFACYCAAGSGEELVALASALGLGALVAGAVEAGPRRVVVEPIGVEYPGEDLELR